MAIHFSEVGAVMSSKLLRGNRASGLVNITRVNGLSFSVWSL
jgi:hypothetical protein